ncbi:Retrovirus-related Pol polyprotein from transposon TNT 1-94 [Glycine soja]|uniref:Retrovirus-related Pol polyprotein from transposon TNT 1-94 n=1 Tax=Glycine soja TaxID=3848 RepID=A0A445H4S7_GLYSO|nr:Retrovirus-related Pol polyprotein from transposon TNT 1-94 [Glycine soja]
METYFSSQDLWDIVEEGFTIPADTSALNASQEKELKKNKQKNSKALFTLQQAVTDPIFPRIMGAKTAKEALNTLQEEFQGSVKVRAVKLQSLRRDFELLKMKESETVKDYYSKVKEIVNQMRAFGEDILDKKIVEKILITMPQKFDPIVTTIEETKDLSTLSETELVSSLEAYEQRLYRHKEDTIENAFQSKFKFQPQNKENRGKKNYGETSRRREGSRNFLKNKTNKNPPCNICKRQGHAEKNCWFHNMPQCNHCKKFGHVEKNCRNKNRHQANIAEEHDQEQCTFYATQDSIKEKGGSWYLDTGCRNHMAKDETIFKSIDESVKVKVRLGNGSVVESKGKGTVMVETDKGGVCKILDNKNKRSEIAQVKMNKSNRSFPLNLKYATNIAMKVQVDDSWLWHQRFGHFNSHALKLLHEKNMMRDLPSIKENNEMCEGCLLGKQHRFPFSTSGAWRAKDLLELIHTDVCGPMRTPSHGNNRYFILFIDDFSRMTWVYFLKEKSEVFGVFKKFKALAENQSGKRIKVLRSDRDKEYTSREFERFCEDEGIERQLTVAYSPQQNGVSERKNRTIMEMARSMLKEKGLPNTFWAEAVYTVVYILNRCPTKSVKDKTPIEAWNGKKPSAKHLRVFGSICYIHIPDVKRHKLEDKTIRGIFLGYSNISKGYRVYNLQTKKLVISRDVEVDEYASWNWDEEKVEKNVLIPAKLPQEEDEEEEPGEPPSPPSQQQDQELSSPESTPRRVRSLVDIYETCNLAILEPGSFEEASKQEVWVKAMEEEIQMIEKNNTWELVNRPHGKDIIGVKWVYKTKLNPDGTIQKHKARLVAKGYSQQPGIDYNETFAPVARLDTIRALIALASQKGWSKENKVLRLRKALYGLKQAPRAWYSRIDQYFMDRKFRMSKSEPTLYIKSQATRPDIMYATSLLSRFMQSPSQIHFGAGKRILRYLQGTKEFGIWYTTETNSELLGYTDNDWAGSTDDMKSTSGYAFSLGSGMFSWASKKQATVAQSTAEAEYVAAAEATSQAIWLRRILEDMGEKQDEPTKINCDNKLAIAMTKNPVHHSRTKHIAIKYHFIREAEATKEIKLDYCRIEDQIADIFTKALPRPRFEELRAMLGVTEICIKEEASKESDIYSFGVVALEIACGRRTYQDGEYHVPLVSWVWQLYVEGNVLDVVDERLNKEFDVDEMTSLIVVGLWCTNPNDKERPKAAQVIKVLQLEASLPVLPLDMHDGPPSSLDTHVQSTYNSSQLVPFTNSFVTVGR